MRIFSIGFAAAAMLAASISSAHAEYMVWLNNRWATQVDVLVDTTPVCSLAGFTGDVTAPTSCTMRLAEGAHTITVVSGTGSVQTIAVDRSSPSHIEIDTGGFNGIGRGMIPYAAPLNLAPLCTANVQYRVFSIQSCMAITLDPSSSREARGRAHFNRGLLHDADGEFSYAITAFGAAIEMNPAVWQHHFGRCNSRMRANVELDGAIADCNEAARIDPTATAPRFVRGLIYARREQWAEALADFEFVVPLTGTWSDPLYLRGYTRRRLGRADGQADMDAALARDPQVAQAYAQAFGFMQ